MAKRTKIAEATKTELSSKSGRRCAICFAWHGDKRRKGGADCSSRLGSQQQKD